MRSTPVYKQKYHRRISRLLLAAVLILNTAALGALELQSGTLAQFSNPSAPCHMMETRDGHHHDHALGCDSLCAQCTGFIPGICAVPDDRVPFPTRFPLTGSDPLPAFDSPLYKPPRA